MDNKLDKILAEISAGELIDKITILEIKKLKITNKDKLIDRYYTGKNCINLIVM